MRLGVILVLWGASLSGFAQFSISQFIRSSTESAAVKTLDTQLIYLQTKPYRLSPLQKLEFRTQNRELLSYQQEYAIRLSPANPWEIRYNNQYFQHYQASLALERNLALKQVLIERYVAVIDFLYYRELKELQTQSLTGMNQQLTVLEKQVASSLFDAREYLSLKVDVVDKSVDVEELAFEEATQKNLMDKLCPALRGQSVTWMTKDIIPVHRIKAVVDSLHEEEIASALLAYRQQQINLAQTEFNLEKSNVNVGFLQTEYDRRRVEQDRTPFNISLGITIPITNPNKGDMAKRKLDLIEAEEELQEAKQEEVVGKSVGFTSLTDLIARYSELERRVAELDGSPLPAQVSNLEGGDPLIALRFQNSVIKLKILQARLARTIQTAYVQYLADTDHLQQRPLINFLSGSLPAAEN
jgi:hypothetical protein